MWNLSPLAAIGAITIASWGIEGFSPPPLHRGYVDSTVTLTVLPRKDNECCSLCSESNHCCSEKQSRKSVDLRQGHVSPVVHTSRRKFVQFMGTGFAAFSSPAMGADFDRTTPTSSILPNNNIIAVPTGPLAPFSSTRTYRNIVLSNGLQVVLVKDTQAQRSSVALTIEGAGQFSDPEELPGKFLVQYLSCL